MKIQAILAAAILAMGCSTAAEKDSGDARDGPRTWAFRVEADTPDRLVTLQEATDRLEADLLSDGFTMKANHLRRESSPAGLEGSRRTVLYRKRDTVVGELEVETSVWDVVREDAAEVTISMRATHPARAEERLPAAWQALQRRIEQIGA